MPHYPKPFFRKSRQLWYVQRDGRQINLGADREAAFAQYHALMAAPKPAPPPVAHSAAPLVVVLCDKFLDWVQKHRSAGTYQWYWWRLQSFCRRYPTLAIDELRPFHVQEWVDAQNIVATTQRDQNASALTLSVIAIPAPASVSMLVAAGVLLMSSSVSRHRF